MTQRVLMVYGHYFVRYYFSAEESCLRKGLKKVLAEHMNNSVYGMLVQQLLYPSTVYAFMYWHNKY